MLEKKQLLKLALISIAFITVGVTIGLALNYQTIQKLREEPETLPTPATPVEEERQEKIATFSGKVKPSIKPEIATHYLEDEGGNLIVFLQSGKIESGFLDMLEGQTVEVMGETIKTVEGGQKVLEVDEVRL